MPRTDLIYFMGGPNNMSPQICEQHGQLTETELCFSKIQWWIYLISCWQNFFHELLITVICLDDSFWLWLVEFSRIQSNMAVQMLKFEMPQNGTPSFFSSFCLLLFGAHMMLHMYGIHSLPHHLVQMTAHFAYGNYCTAHWDRQTFWLCALTKGCLQSKEFMKIVSYSK